jgi:hypothetical protein
MAREGYFKNWKNITKVSFGLVAVLFLLWLVFHTTQYVPDDQKDFWIIVFLSYGVLTSVIFGNADVRNRLFNVKFVKLFPRIALFFCVFLVIFYFMFHIVDPLEQSLFGVLRNIPFWLAVVHAFVFATLESAVWQGYLDYELGHPWSELTAGVFHWGVWTGGAFIVIPSAALLFAVFSGVNWYFRKDKNDIAPAIGTHIAFNFVKLGILLSV